MRARITICAALNLPYPAWQDFPGNPALTKTLLSRLRERCHTITINGPCIRPQTGRYGLTLSSVPRHILTNQCSRFADDFHTEEATRRAGGGWRRGAASL